MKKTILLSGLALLGLVSCKKNYTCECVQTMDIMGQVTKQTITTPIKDTKSNATDACKALSVKSTSVTMDCAIK